MRPKKKRILLLFAAFLSVIIVSISILSFLPMGKCVYVFASVTPGGVSINGCSLKTVYLLAFGSGIPAGESGNRTIVVKVFSGLSELASFQRSAVSFIGNYEVNTPNLPSGLSVGTELRVVVELRDGAGELVSEEETVVVYS